MPESRPRISVVMPCYNDGGFIDEALDSLAAQTVQDFEVIVVDDGSTDAATREVLDGLRRPRTRLLRSADNRGPGAARNLGLAEARGELLCALDADDRLSPRYLEATLAALEAEPALTWASTWLHMFGAESWIRRQDRCDLAALLADCTVHGAALVRLEPVRAAGGYDAAMREGNEDWDLWLRLAERGHRGTIVPEPLFHYRRRAGSLSTVTLARANHLRLISALLDKHRDSLVAHLDEVLALKDAEAVEHLTAAERLQTLSDEFLAPATVSRREELHVLAARVAELRAPRAAAAASTETEIAVAAARHEVAALRRSLSWRITAPLRAAWDLLRGRRPTW